MPSTPPIAGRVVVLWLSAAGLLLLAVFAWVLNRGLRMSAAEQQRSQRLAPAISTGAGTMRLVPAGKFIAGEDAVPVNLPAFYIGADPVRTGASYNEATQSCAEHGLRLPSTIEWEKAFEQTTPQREWVAEPHRPKQFELRAFKDPLNPPPSAAEEWSTLRGGAGAKRTGYTSAPSRFVSADIAFRCALTPR